MLWRLCRWLIPVALALVALAAKDAQASGFVRGVHGCSNGPFHFNMSLPAPAALSDPVFKHPWVQHNVAVTFDPMVTRDGLGSQLQRQMGVYAMAVCAGLRYVPTRPYDRFTHLNRTEAHQLAHRVNTLLGIPDSTNNNEETAGSISSSSGWRVVDFDRSCSITWDTLLHETKAALAAQQPTLFNVSFVYGFALTYPAMLTCVPAFRQQPPQCGQPLLRPVRLAVHIRAGDAENDGRRLLPHAYFFEIIRTLTKVLRHMKRDYVVEVYTQAAFGIRHHSNGSHSRIDREEYVQDLQHNIGRHMVLLADIDPAWTFNQMSSADVLVHSKSAFSIGAGIINTQGINIAPPEGSLPWPWLQAHHWLHTANESGAFDAQTHGKLAVELQVRFGAPCRTRLLEGAEPLQPVQQQQKPAVQQKQAQPVAKSVQQQQEKEQQPDVSSHATIQPPPQEQQQQRQEVWREAARRQKQQR